MEKALWRRYKFDLGIHTLLPEWRNLFNKKTILNDVMAGITVACVAIPLTLAIGLASGVTPEASIITAIVTGIVCALFGGTTLTVSGPAAAMSILLASIVETHGMSGLIIMTLLAGFMQLLSGIFGLGKFTRFVPIPVIAGFTAGIGLIILVGQLPRAFGLPPPEQSHIFFVFSHLIQYSENINFVPLFIVALTLVIMRTWSKITTKIPAPLMAVIVPTLLVNILPMGHLETIGEIPRYLPPIVIPQLPSNLNWMELFAGAFTIYLLASLETLLSANAVDKITKEHEHDSNQELVGQGLGNMAVSLVGGIAVTGVIARSVTNIAAGAKTRLSSIVHSLVILATVFALAPFMSQIPIAVLAGVLFYIALSMINVKEFLDYWRTSKTEGGIYGATFLVIVLVDLIAGVQVGIAAAMLIVLLRLAKTNLHFSSQTYDNIIRLSLDGNINFLSANKISELKSQFGDLKKNQYVILDLSRVNDMDSSGSESIVDLINRYHGTHLHFFIKGLPKRFETLFELFGGKNFLEPLLLTSESDLKDKIGGTRKLSFRGRLLHGVQQFHTDRQQDDRALFKAIAHAQDPHTLFITCADSRVIPSEMTNTDPGELFSIRNVGNLIPIYSTESVHSEAAAIEFALTELNIHDIVICGHSNCGAIKACCEGLPNDRLKQVELWIEQVKKQIAFNTEHEIDYFSRLNVLQQIENLKTYPLVKKYLAKHKIALHAWYFDMHENIVYEWDEKTNTYTAIGEPSKLFKIEISSI